MAHARGFVAVSVALLAELLLAVLARKWLFVQVNAQVVFQAAHFGKLVHAVVAFQNLVGPACQGIVLVHFRVVVLQLPCLLSLLNTLALLADYSL